MTCPGVTISPGAYVQTPPLLNECPAVNKTVFSLQGVYVLKLRASDWQPVYSTLISSPCGIQPGTPSVDGAGRVAIPVATGQEFPLHHPLLAGTSCSITSSAVAVLSADAARLDFATYLDNCGVPAVTWASDGSFYAGVTHGYFGPTGVLHVPTTPPAAVSLDGVANTFSGDASAVVGEGIYTITGSGFAPPATDLGNSPAHDLPLELNNVQVRFDGVPAAIRATGPGR